MNEKFKYMCICVLCVYCMCVERVLCVRCVYIVRALCVYCMYIVCEI